MDTAPENNQDLDLKLLSDFIYEMNIARRYALSYPPEHPIITNAAVRVIHQLEKLLESQPAVTLGIAQCADICRGVERHSSLAVIYATELRSYTESLDCCHFNLLNRPDGRMAATGIIRDLVLNPQISWPSRSLKG